MNPAVAPLCVVLSPDLVGAATWDPSCEDVLVAWRDARVRPVLNAELLRRYLRVHAALGICEPVRRRWAWWFTSPDKVDFLNVALSPDLTVAELCTQIALAGRARWILAVEIPAPVPDQTKPVPEWINAEAFLKKTAADPG